MKYVEFNIPAVRGFQGEHAVYAAMCPIRLLPKLFPVGVDNSTTVESHSFRRANMKRVHEIANYLLENRDDFHMATVTVSIEHKVRFVAAENAHSKTPTIGQLFIPLEARLTILDGVHRIYGVQKALAKNSSLANDAIAMLLHVDPNGSRRRQLFSDTKQHERTTAPSRRIAFDERDELARLTREVIMKVPVFGDAIEMDKTAISNRSRKLFTLSALYQANRELLADRKKDSYKQRLKLATEFWIKVAEQIPGWSQIIRSDKSAAEIRANYVHCHAIGVAAIARAGRALLALHPDDWNKRLTKLSSLDWSRRNTKLWEGRAMIGGRLSKSSSAVARAGNAVKRHLGIRLSAEEEALEV